MITTLKRAKNKPLVKRAGHRHDARLFIYLQYRCRKGGICGRPLSIFLSASIVDGLLLPRLKAQLALRVVPFHVVSFNPGALFTMLK